MDLPPYWEGAYRPAIHGGVSELLELLSKAVECPRGSFLIGVRLISTSKPNSACKDAAGRFRTYLSLVLSILLQVSYSSWRIVVIYSGLLVEDKLCRRNRVPLRAAVRLYTQQTQQWDSRMAQPCLISPRADTPPKHRSGFPRARPLQAEEVACH